VTGSAGLFERLVLEGMQAGLSWITVLRKRAHMHARFFGFDIERLATAGEDDLQSWLADAGLIRHRGKLEAMVCNARLVRDHDDFPGWIWSFAPPSVAVYDSISQVPSITAESKAMSRALKKSGFKFVGPTTCYAFMQSVGMVNDHVAGCFRNGTCTDLRNRVNHTS
jgi:DNA-3-methyladenine glycosylase I